MTKDADRLQVYLELLPSGEVEMKGAGWLCDEVARLERRMEEEGPLLISPEWFWCLITPVSTPVTASLTALTAFAEPAIEHSEMPTEFWAWVAEDASWRFIFHASMPHMDRWTDGEHAVVRLEGLEEYYWVTHHADGEFDTIGRVKDGQFDAFQVVEGDYEGPDDVDIEPNESAVWDFLQRETTLEQSYVASMIRNGKPMWLVHRQQLVPRKWREERHGPAGTRTPPDVETVPKDDGGRNDRPVAFESIFDLLVHEARESASEEDILPRVEAMVDAGADLEWRDEKDWRTALSVAAECGWTNVMRFMLARGADPEARDKDNGVPLFWAAFAGEPEAAETLLDAGADVNWQDDDGWTALMFTASYDQPNTAKVLLERGALPSLKDVEGRTAMDVAKEFGGRNALKVIERMQNPGTQNP